MFAVGRSHVKVPSWWDRGGLSVVLVTLVTAVVVRRNSLFEPTVWEHVSWFDVLKLATMFTAFTTTLMLLAIARCTVPSLL